MPSKGLVSLEGDVCDVALLKPAGTCSQELIVKYSEILQTGC